MSRTAAGRLVIFVILAAHMELGGVVHQVLRRPTPPTAMTWEMYSAPGRDLCEVRWYRADGGALEPVDRLGVMAFPKPWKAPEKSRHLRGVDQVRTAANRLCKLLGASADIRAEARCGRGGRGQWEDVLTTDEPLCGSL